MYEDSYLDQYWEDRYEVSDAMSGYRSLHDEMTGDSFCKHGHNTDLDECEACLEEEEEEAA